ncbi:MAG: GbsR/MarR family transcriptional regulator [Thermocrispum sp.]
MSSRPESQRDPTPDDDESVLQFIEHFTMVMAAIGMPRMSARVFTALLATEQESLTAGELSEWLKISPAAVSGAVRYLVQLGMVHRGRIPGTRRDHYLIGDDQWYEAVSMKDNAYQRLAGSLDEGLAAVRPGGRASERIAETRDFFTFIAKEMPVLVARWQDERRAGVNPARPS